MNKIQSFVLATLLASTTSLAHAQHEAVIQDAIVNMQAIDEISAEQLEKDKASIMASVKKAREQGQTYEQVVFRIMEVIGKRLNTALGKQINHCYQHKAADYCARLDTAYAVLFKDADGLSASVNLLAPYQKNQQTIAIANKWGQAENQRFTAQVKEISRKETQDEVANASKVAAAKQQMIQFW